MNKYLMIILSTLMLYACGEKGGDTIVNNSYYTTNDTLWEEINSPEAMSPAGHSFWTDKNDNLILLGYGFDMFTGKWSSMPLIFVSRDFGKTWANVSSNMSDSASFYLMNYNNIIVYSNNTNGNYGYFRSIDAGSTWQKVYEYKGIAQSSYLMDIDSKNNIYIEANVNSQYDLYKSSDNGLSWQMILNCTRKNLYEMISDKFDNLYVLYKSSDWNSDGKSHLLFSSDYGSSWNEVNSFAAMSDGGSVDLHTDLLGNLYLNNFAKSTDKGKTWKYFTTNGIHAINLCIRVFSLKGNIYLNDNYTISRSTDDGSTWQSIFKNIQNLGFCIDSKGYAYIIKQDGRIYRTKQPIE